MLTADQRIKVFNAIPNNLCGITLPKRVTDQYVQAPLVPGIEITYLVQGVRARWSSSPIVQKYNPDTRVIDERWGQLHKCILSITINSYDKAQLFDLASAMVTEIFRTRLGLVWRRDRVKFIDVVSSPIYTSIRIEQDRKLVHRAHIDVWLEYELSWSIDAPEILAFSCEYNGEPIGISFKLGSYGCTAKVAAFYRQTLYDCTTKIVDTCKQESYGCTVKIVASS